MAIASALGQSYSSVEVIVVDNDSADATLAEVQRRFGQRVRYFRQPNSGEGGGYNRGIAESRGEFVHLLDGDDVMAPTMIEKQVAMLEANDSLGAVYGDVHEFVERGATPLESAGPTSPVWDHDDLLMTLIRGDDKGCLIASSILFRRSTLNRLGSFITRNDAGDELWWQAEREYLFRAAYAGLQCRYTPGALVFYRQHGGQMSRHIAAMQRGMELLIEQAVQSVAREPHHGMLRSIRARQHYGRAIDGAGGKRQALRDLWDARITDSKTISVPHCVLAVLVVLMPSGRSFYRLQWRLRRSYSRRER